MRQDESDIIDNIISGKTEEFSYFLDKYGQSVYTLIVRIVCSECDAEELTQDTFIKAFENLSKFGGKSSFSTWIYRIAYNTAISFMRKRNSDNNEINVLDDNTWNFISDTEIDEAMNDDRDEQVEKLQNALSKLPPDEKALVTLFYEEERTIQEIGQILNISESNIKVKLHRIRKKLYIFMQKDELE